MMEKSFRAILVSVLMVDAGQLLLKKGLSINAFSFDMIFSILLFVFTNMYVLLGLMAVILSSIIWLSVLSRSDLSYAYPMLGLGYVIVALASWFLFNEQVTIIRWLGIFIICSGVFLMSKS